MKSVLTTSKGVHHQNQKCVCVRAQQKHIFLASSVKLLIHLDFFWCEMPSFGDSGNRFVCFLLNSVELDGNVSNVSLQKSRPNYSRYSTDLVCEQFNAGAIYFSTKLHLLTLSLCCQEHGATRG